MRALTLPIWLLTLFALIDPASGQAIVKKEPAPGTMRAADFVYLDDGSCPKGQI